MKIKLFLLLVVTGLVLSLTYAQNDIKVIQTEKAPQFNQNQLLQQLLLLLSQFTKENQLIPLSSIVNPEILKGETQSEPTLSPTNYGIFVAK